MDDHFGVGMVSAKAVSGRTQFAAQSQVVVDLAVEDDPDGFILVGHWLGGSSTEIDDGEATVRQPDAPIRGDPVSTTVRTAMHHGVAHLGEDFFFHPVLTVIAINTGYTAHIMASIDALSAHGREICCST